MENPEKRKFFGVVKNLPEIISTALHTKTVSMLVLLAIIAAVPLTVYVAQKQQETRQRAEGFCEAGAMVPRGCTGRATNRTDNKVCPAGQAEKLVSRCNSDGTGYESDNFFCSDDCAQYHGTTCVPDTLTKIECTGQATNRNDDNKRCSSGTGEMLVQRCDERGASYTDERYYNCDPECSQYNSDTQPSVTQQPPPFGGPPVTCEFNGTPYNYGDKIWDECGADGGGIPKVCNENGEWQVNGDRECARPNFCPGTCNTGGQEPSPTEEPPAAPPPAAQPPPSTVSTCKDLPAGDGKVWKANCGTSSCFVTDDTSNKEVFNSRCPKNDFDTGNIDPNTSNWCYGFDGPNHSKDDWRCLQLVRTSCQQRGASGCSMASTCQAGTVKPRFRVEGSGLFPDVDENGKLRSNPPIVQVNSQVFVSVLRGDNNKPATGIATATVTGPGINKTVDVNNTDDSFKPAEAGDYILKATCGQKVFQSTLKVNGIPDCNQNKVDMTAKPVKNPTNTEIFVNEFIKFVVKGEQGENQKKDTWTPQGVVDCAGAFFGSKLCKATGAGTIEWKHSWKNCAVGSETNCKPECSKSIPLTIKAIPNFEMEGNVSSESAGARLTGMPGLTIKIRNDETNVTVNATTDANGNFAAPNLLPRGDRYTIKIDGFDAGSPRIGGKDYFATTDYPVHTTFYENKTGDKKIQIKLKEKTADVQVPIGKITAGTCETGLKGYACIRNNNKIVNVEIKDFGSTVIGRVPANLSGLDSECGNNHWFEFEPPMSLKDNAQHSISIRAVNPDSGSKMELPGSVADLNSPLTFICTTPADLTGPDHKPDGALDIYDYNFIRDAYHYQTPFDTRGASISSITEGTTSENNAVRRYLNAQGKVDLRGVAKWMIDMYLFLK
ncbi:MAG: carboxypeptidase-like regulatory domain-containing protein [Patescibacteria group bacterium]|nr:carboxypeptidase-like regulatory domain-containing protein [Patescibacteria group bacterium]